MKIIAYILFALQLVSAAGHVMGNGFSYLLMVMFSGGLPGFIGFMLPTIAGILLLLIHSKREMKKHSISSDTLAEDPTAWVCAKCGTINMAKVNTCQGCGVSRQWTDSKKSK